MNHDDEIDPVRYVNDHFPSGLLADALEALDYTDVKVAPCGRDRLRVTMRYDNEPIVEAVVEQQLAKISIDDLLARAQWNIDCAVAVITGQQITAAIKVSPAQMAHQTTTQDNAGLVKG
jgi:hypothetical protein